MPEGYKETAKTLSALIMAQSGQKEAFEEKIKQDKETFDLEMAEKKALWEKKQALLEFENNERKQQLEKSRKRYPSGKFVLRYNF